LTTIPVFSALGAGVAGGAVAAGGMAAGGVAGEVAGCAAGAGAGGGAGGLTWAWADMAAEKETAVARRKVRDMALRP
jgi:hypothetical protein